MKKDKNSLRGAVLYDGCSNADRLRQERSDADGSRAVNRGTYRGGHGYDAADLLPFLETIDDPRGSSLAGQIAEYLRRMIDVGIGYLSLSRKTETLSKEYGITKGETALDRAGNCIVIHADADKTDQITMDQLQAVYIIPSADGCLVAWGHNTFDSADFFGALYHNMMQTFVVCDD